MSDEGELSVVHVTTDTTERAGPAVGAADGIDASHRRIDEAADVGDADALLAGADVAGSEALAGLIRANDAACVVADPTTDDETTAGTLRRAVAEGWRGYPVPASERARLDALGAYDFDDPTLRAHLRGMTTTARECLDARAAFVGLVGERHETFLTAEGVDLPDRERGRAVCAHGITNDGVLAVDDVTASERGARVAPDLASYAGAPLVAGGERVGMLCVADDEAGAFDEADAAVLERLAEQTARHVERYGAT